MGEAALTLDVAQGIEEIDVGPPPTPYDRAETLAADLYGAQQTWFLSNGATQGNHALCLTLAPEGAGAVAQRNSHGSLVDGLVLSGGVPRWVAPEYDDDLGMAHGVTPDAVAAALAGAPATRAVFVGSAPYSGLAAPTQPDRAAARSARRRPPADRHPRPGAARAHRGGRGPRGGGDRRDRGLPGGGKGPGRSPRRGRPRPVADRDRRARDRLHGL